MKITWWIGMPSLVALTAWLSPFLDNIHFFFVLSVAALLVAILPRLMEASDPKTS